jgi:hypothetical protein
MKKLHRDLRPIPLTDVLPLGSRPQLVITMGEAQWDSMLAAAYNDGWVLLEIDHRERPVRAYQKAAIAEPAMATGVE